MEGVEQRRVDERARPDHAGRPDDELAKKTTEGETKDLGSENQGNLVCESDILIVEHLLGEDDISGIGAADDHVRHNGDADVLLDVEWTWVEGPFNAEGAEYFLGE